MIFTSVTANQLRHHNHYILIDDFIQTREDLGAHLRRITLKVKATSGKSFYQKSTHSTVTF